MKLKQCRDTAETRAGRNVTRLRVLPKKGINLRVSSDTQKKGKECVVLQKEAKGTV